MNKDFTRALCTLISSGDHMIEVINKGADGDSNSTIELQNALKDEINKRKKKQTQAQAKTQGNKLIAPPSKKTPSSFSPESQGAALEEALSTIRKFVSDDEEDDSNDDPDGDFGRADVAPATAVVTAPINDPKPHQAPVKNTTGTTKKLNVKVIDKQDEGVDLLAAIRNIGRSGGL